MNCVATVGNVRMHICGIDDWSCGLTRMEIVQALILVSCLFYFPFFGYPFPVEREQERVKGGWRMELGCYAKCFLHAPHRRCICFPDVCIFL
jgi:hypothetical protein